MMKLFREFIHFLSLIGVVRQDSAIAVLHRAGGYWFSRVFALSLPYNLPKIFAVLRFGKLLSPISKFRVTYLFFDTIPSGFGQASSVCIFVVSLVDL